MGSKVSKAKKVAHTAEAIADGFEMVEPPLKKPAKLTRKNVSKGSRRGILGSKKKQKRLSTIPPSEPEGNINVPTDEHHQPQHDMDGATEGGGEGFDTRTQPEPGYPHEVDPSHAGGGMGDRNMGTRQMQHAARGQAEFYDDQHGGGGEPSGTIRHHDYADPGYDHGGGTEYGYSQAGDFPQHPSGFMDPGHGSFHPSAMSHGYQQYQDQQHQDQQHQGQQYQGQQYQDQQHQDQQHQDQQHGSNGHMGGGGPHSPAHFPTQTAHDVLSAIKGRHLSRAQLFEDAKESVEYILSQMDKDNAHTLRSAMIREAMRGVEQYMNADDGQSPRQPSDKSFLAHICGLSVGPGQHILRCSKNNAYKRDGFKDYARAVKRHRIQLREHNAIFWDKSKNCLMKRDPGQKHHPGRDIYTAARMTGGSQVRAEDVQNGSEFLCPVTIGTPGVTLDLDFDTGSSDLWVWSSETNASWAEKREHDIYSPRKSRTSHEIKGVTWKISYADGSSASGDAHEDIVKIGQVTIARQAVEVAQHVSSSFMDSESDGILGLAFHRLNTASTKQKTPMDNMIEQRLLRDPIFTVKLDKGDSNGFYTFGYINKPPKSSQLYWTRIITDNGYWEFRSNYMKFGDQIYNRVKNTAILDTGTTLILLHDTFVHLIYSAIPGAHLDSDHGGYVFPTNTRIPPLSFCVGDFLFTIPGADLAFADAGDSMSFGAVQSRGDNPQDILGCVFLKHVYAVFDLGTDPKYGPRLGIAQRT